MPRSPRKGSNFLPATRSPPWMAALWARLPPILMATLISLRATTSRSPPNGLEIDRTFGGQPLRPQRFAECRGTDFTLGSSLAINVDNSVAGNLNDGANITLDIGNNLTINGGGALSLLIANNDGGHIGTGGNVSLTTGGNLTADSMSVAINNRAGGVIDSGVNLTLNIGGALTTLHDGVDFSWKHRKSVASNLEQAR